MSGKIVVAGLRFAVVAGAVAAGVVLRGQQERIRDQERWLDAADERIRELEAMLRVAADGFVLDALNPR